MSSFQLKKLVMGMVHIRQLVRHDEDDRRGVGIRSLTAKTGLSDCTRLGGSAIAAGIQEDTSLASRGLFLSL